MVLALARSPGAGELDIVCADFPGRADCGSRRFLGFGYDPAARDGAEPNPGGVKIAPLGFALVARGCVGLGHRARRR